MKIKDIWYQVTVRPFIPSPWKTSFSTAPVFEDILLGLVHAHPRDPRISAIYRSRGGYYQAVAKRQISSEEIRRHHLNLSRAPNVD
jgi:hypothetical protein